MKVSIIVPFKSGDAFLTDCFDSLTAQNFKDYEIILVTDHYKGDIGQLIAPYRALADIKVYALTGSRTGVAAARNEGLDHAQGEFVYFIDADDYIFEEAVGTLVERADELNADYVYGKFHKTYFKREIFLPVYIEKREEAKRLAALEAENAEGSEEDTDEDFDHTEDGEDNTESTDEEEGEIDGEASEDGYEAGDDADYDAEPEEGIRRQGIVYVKGKRVLKEGEVRNDEEDEIPFYNFTEYSFDQLLDAVFFEGERAVVPYEELTEEEQEYRRARKRAIARREDAYRKAIRRGITKKTRFRNVTVLHKLIRRSVIEDEHIRFDESLTYYSDFPFLAQVLSTPLRTAKWYYAHYIKRKHSDTINNPALYQIQDERRFGEMLRMFSSIIDSIEEESSVRRAVDHQIIIYFTGYFIKKMRRSENEFWRNERFEEMRTLIARIPKEHIKREKSFRKRMIRALLKGNKKKCIRLISFRLGRKKAKRLIKKNKTGMIGKYLYRHKYLQQPIQENLIIFESFLARNYSDSPKYIYEYLAKNYPGKFKFVWVLDNDTKLPYEGEKVKRFSKKYMRYMATAKYFVFNMRQPMWFKKRPEMVFLETWHGTPLKKLVFDLEEVYSASPLYKKEVYKQSREWDYLIAANEFSSITFKRCFKWNGHMLEFGYPRNDILHAPDRDRIEAQLREKLHIPKDKKTILYAPTWRDDEYITKGKYSFELKLDLKLMQEQLGDEYVVLLRTHYFIASALDLTGMEDFAYNFCSYNDISELYLVSDIIITDYSSVFFDYANLKRPMLFYTYDLEKYRDVLRGFYIDIEEELPGPLLFTTQEVIDAVRDIASINKTYAAKYDVFYEKYCGWEDGHASENVVKEVFGSISD